MLDITILRKKITMKFRQIAQKSLPRYVSIVAEEFVVYQLKGILTFIWLYYKIAGGIFICQLLL
jgi:hypothetical protein